jgi:CRP/FNR family cyclic AMP-dependent transcriptional regulator
MDTILEQVDIFKGLSREDLDVIARISKQQRFSANDVIFTEKSKGKEMFVVARGQVRVELGIGGKNDRATVHRITEGEVLGELVIVGDERRSGTARCETDCELIAIDRDELLAFFNANTSVGYTVMRNLASLLGTRLRKTNLQLIACFLWE